MQKTATIEVPLNLLIKFVEGYEDLDSLAGIVQCYCDDQPEAEYENEHRGDHEAYKQIQALITATPDEVERFKAIEEERRVLKATLKRYEVNMDLGVFAVVRAGNDSEAVDVAQRAVNAELAGAPLPAAAESVTIGDFHGEDATQVVD